MRGAELPYLNHFRLCKCRTDDDKKRMLASERCQSMSNDFNPARQAR